MATLTVTIQENLYINSQSLNNTVVKHYTDIDNIYSNQGTLPPGQSCILYQTTGSNTWFGNSLGEGLVKYVRITNTATGSYSTGSAFNTASYTGSSTVSSVLRLSMTAFAGGTSAHSLYPGDSFILNSHSGSYNGNAAGIGSPSLVYKNISGIKAGSQGGPTSYTLVAYGTN